MSLRITSLQEMFPGVDWGSLPPRLRSASDVGSRSLSVAQMQVDYRQGALVTTHLVDEATGGIVFLRGKVVTTNRTGLVINWEDATLYYKTSGRSAERRVGVITQPKAGDRGRSTVVFDDHPQAYFLQRSYVSSASVTEDGAGGFLLQPRADRLSKPAHLGRVINVGRSLDPTKGKIELNLVIDRTNDVVGQEFHLGFVDHPYGIEKEVRFKASITTYTQRRGKTGTLQWALTDVRYRTSPTGAYEPGVQAINNPNTSLQLGDSYYTVHKYSAAVEEGNVLRTRIVLNRIPADEFETKSGKDIVAQLLGKRNRKAFSTIGFSLGLACVATAGVMGISSLFHAWEDYKNNSGSSLFESFKKRFSEEFDFGSFFQSMALGVVDPYGILSFGAMFAGRALPSFGREGSSTVS